MAGIISALGTVGEIFAKSSEGLSGKDIVKVLGSRDLALIRSNGSMLKMLGNYIVEPVCVVTDDLKENEIIDKLIGLHSDMFTGYYMQALDILRYMYGLSDREAITIAGTDNGGEGKVLLKGAEIALEDNGIDYFGDVLKDGFVLTVEDLNERKFQYQVGKDAADRRIEIADTKYKKHRDDVKDNQFNATHNNKVKQQEQQKLDKKNDLKQRKKDLKLRDAHFRAKDHNKPGTELSQGRKDLLIPNALQRTVDITVVRNAKDGSQLTVVIPVTIKTQLIYTNANNIINTMSPNSDDKSFMSRLDDYRASAVSFYDFVFASDLVKKYKHNKLKDKDELLKLLQSRKLSANSKAVDRGIVGFEKFYTMYLISKEASISIENFIKGKLKSNRAKETFLEQAYGLSVAVVDEDYERVKLYMKDLKGATDLTFKSIVKREKGDQGYDELVKSLLANRQPQF